MMNEINAQLQVLAQEASQEQVQFQYDEMQASYWNWLMMMVERHERDMEFVNA